MGSGALTFQSLWADQGQLNLFSCHDLYFVSEADISQIFSVGWCEAGGPAR